MKRFNIHIQLSVGMRLINPGESSEPIKMWHIHK